MGISPPVTWFGGKAKLASRIISHFPQHQTYVEPFGGSAAVLLAKPPSQVEVYNDIDHDLVNLFRVLRDPTLYRRLEAVCSATLYARAEFQLAQQASDDPVESARRFMVRQRQSHSGMGRRWSYCVEDAQGGMSSAVRRWLAGVRRLPAIHQRLRGVQIEAADWSEIIQRYDRPRTLFYLDPPYETDTRVGGRYRHELGSHDHRDLIATILAVKGMVVLSGYQCDLYLPLEAQGWSRVDYDVPAYISPARRRRVESLWISPSARQAMVVRDSGLASLPISPGMRGGAYYTHRVRVESTEARIRHAIESIQGRGHRATISAVARELDMSREHIGRRYGHLIPGR